MTLRGTAPIKAASSYFPWYNSSRRKVGRETTRTIASKRVWEPWWLGSHLDVTGRRPPPPLPNCLMLPARSTEGETGLALLRSTPASHARTDLLASLRSATYQLHTSLFIQAPPSHVAILPKKQMLSPRAGDHAHSAPPPTVCYRARADDMHGWTQCRIATCHWRRRQVIPEAPLRSALFPLPLGGESQASTQNHSCQELAIPRHHS